MGQDLNTAIYAAVADYCDKTRTNAGVFHGGKPKIDFEDFLITYLPNPEYGAGYRRRFGAALEVRYEKLEVGQLISLMEREKVKELASKEAIDLSGPSDSEGETSAGRKSPKRDLAKPIARKVGRA